MTIEYTTVTVAPDPDQDDCLAAAAAAYLAEHPGLRGYDLEPRWANDSRESIELTVPVHAAKAEHHWIVGGGSVGCLYDYGPDACETLDDAIDALAGVYDLTTAEKNELRWHKYLSFDRDPGSALEDESGGLSRYHEAGADYCEITCHDGPCPEPEDE